jgi:hypothetical protein
MQIDPSIYEIGEKAVNPETFLLPPLVSQVWKMCDTGGASRDFLI